MNDGLTMLEIDDEMINVTVYITPPDDRSVMMVTVRNKMTTWIFCPVLRVSC